MKNAKLIVEANVLDKIACSTKMGEAEKLNFLRFVGYMSTKEKRSLSLII